MDGFTAVSPLRKRRGLLLAIMMIASLLYQDQCCCLAVNDDQEFAQMKVKEGVIFHGKDWFHRRLLQVIDMPTPPSPPPPPPPDAGIVGSTPPPPSQGLPTPPSPPIQPPAPKINEPPPPTRVTTSAKSSSKSRKQSLVIGLVIAGIVFLVVCGFCVFYWNSKSSHTLKPWMAGLSGQLQRAFVTGTPLFSVHPSIQKQNIKHTIPSSDLIRHSGVPKLNRSELESACEEFSNVIGTSSIGKVFKGTLSTGVEIAVISLATDSVDDWSRSLKTQFRKKIEALSKINHKNFINLIGYCEEDTPFTRMLVFEYAPYGTLYEHLHFQESEHLNWAMRLRILMGVSYCLEHMHHLKPPAIHKNLCSSAISLSEDYAAKVTDFTFWNDSGPTEIQSAELEQMQPSIPSNVACFGKLLFEIVTGKGTYLMSSEYIHSWASEYLNDSTKAPDVILDPTLASVPPAEIIEVVKVIKSCMQPDSKRRPSMKEVTAMMREITSIGPDGAAPKISPLWWAELEVISTDES